MPLKKPITAPAAAARTAAGQQAKVAELRATSAEQRWAAARSLSGYAGALVALEEALANETDRRVRAAIFTSLASIDSQESFTVALRYLRADDAQRHGEALEALKLMPDLALENLEPLLHDADTDVRILACNLARDLASPRAARSLAQLLRSERDLNVCATAIDVLAETGDPEDLAGLDACAARFPDEPFLTFSIKTAAQRIRSRSNPADA
ncbi:HEAT repeat domain-containing protein [Acidocella sp.]|jgi:HEAT repeat protein|uniref:HEAT repeat domain-containing protein n=1 Tax=Acidocella sp. TaxID=50710 RepID=UPI002F41077E